MEPDSDWFDRIYRENWSKMYRSVSFMLNPETAKELTQEVFVILLSKMDQLRYHPNITGWLYITLRNQVGNELQRQKYRNTVSLEDQTNVGATDEYALLLRENLPSGLSEAEQIILSFFYEDKLTHEEIAQRLGCSQTASRCRLYRAKVHFKELVTQDFS